MLALCDQLTDRDSDMLSCWPNSGPASPCELTYIARETKSSACYQFASPTDAEAKCVSAKYIAATAVDQQKPQSSRTTVLVSSNAMCPSRASHLNSKRRRCLVSRPPSSETGPRSPRDNRLSSAEPAAGSASRPSWPPCPPPPLPPPRPQAPASAAPPPARSAAWARPCGP